MSLPISNRSGFRFLRSIFILAIALSPVMLLGQGDPVPNYVVNTTADDATGTASNCTSSPEGVCTLRDALAAANKVAAGNVTFDPTVFLESNSAAANTITLANGTLNIPTGTTITGLTTGSGATLTNLVTVSGNNATRVFTVVSSAAAIANLNITNGFMPFSSGDLAPGGGIYNGGFLTVTKCTFSGNYGGHGGGAIYSYNLGNSILTVIDSTFIGNSAQLGGAIEVYVDSGASVTGSTFVNNSASDGGGIYVNNGGLTVTSSTFINNSASATVIGPQASAGGGAILTWATHLTVTSSTFSRNSAADAGGAINYVGDNPDFILEDSTLSGNSAQISGGIAEDDSSVNIANSIVEGNFATGEFPDIGEGGLNYGFGVNDLGGNLINTSKATIFEDPLLTPLGDYGGSTQTMLPEPGSLAICGGVAANIPAGVTTDQRGYPIENTTYPGYSSKAPCVDSGAIQTHYALAFTTQPPANATYEAAIAPAPVVTVTESGNPVGAVNAGTVRMTDSSNMLSGTTSEGLMSGTATFGYLVLPTAVTDDIFTAWLGLNPMLNISALASVGVTAVAPTGPVPAIMLSPGPGTATFLGTSNILFQWTKGFDVTSYELFIGTSGVGSSNILNIGPITTTSYRLLSLPANGVPLYVRLGSLINGAWQTEDYQYTESAPATMLSPIPGTATVLGTSNILFQWTPGSGVARYELLVGTSGVGSSNILNTGALNTTSYTVPVLPSNGVTLYVRLGSLINGVWQTDDYQYTESGPPVIQSPAPGTATILGASNVTFTWTPGTGATLYDFWLGTTGVGSDNVYVSGQITSTSATAPKVPYGLATDTVYVRLWYLIDDTWQYTDYTYSATPSVAPVLTSPTPGSVLGTSNVTFTWTPGTGPTLYDFWLGTKGVGSDNVYVAGHITTTSATAPKVPYGLATDTLYVRLSYLIDDTWQYTDYTYSATPSVAPVLTSPTPGSILGTSNVTFTWTAGTGPTLYDFWLSNNGVGTDDLYVSGRTTATSVTAPTVPAQGATIYVRLWYLIDNTWQSTDYTYTEQ